MCLQWTEHAAHYSLGGKLLSFVNSQKSARIVANKLKFNLHVHSVVQKASCLSGNILRSTINRSPFIKVSLLVSHIRSILEYCSCLWNAAYIGNLRMLESIQRRCTKRIEGFYAHCLEKLNLYSVFWQACALGFD